MVEDAAPFLCPPVDGSAPKWDEIEEDLRDMRNTSRQLAALKDLIRHHSSGDRAPDSVLMTTIQYISTSQDHSLKKLLFLYYEIVETRDRKGELKQEFLLICDALRNDLLHPNEYLRAAALRLASKFQEPDLLAPLVSTISESLSHKSAYVRRHAVVAIGRINQRWPRLAPDAPSEIAELLRKENDQACKRVAFLVLCDISRELAAEFLDDVVEGSLLNLPQPMQLTATALIRNLCSDKRKASYLSALTELIQSPSPGVQLESALTLLDLTRTPTASKAGLMALTQIMLNIPNASLQRSIADQIDRLIPTHTTVCQSLAVEFLAALKAKPIRRKILSIVEKLITASNVIDVSSTLVRHMQAASALRQKENERADAIEFIKMIIASLRVFFSSQPICGKTIYEGVISLICDQESAVAIDAMVLVRDLLSTNADLRAQGIAHLENVIGNIHPPRAFRMAIYLLSLYSESNETIDKVCDALSLEQSSEKAGNTTTVVLQDGTYVQKTNVVSQESSDTFVEMLHREPFLISALSMALARLCVRLPDSNRERASAFVKNLLKTVGVERELRRIAFALSAMDHPENERLKKVVVSACEDSFEKYVSSQQKELAIKPIAVSAHSAQLVEERLNFGALLGRRFDPPTRRITREEKKRGVLWQITGTSDPIFCECEVRTSRFDIVLDFRLANQTNVELKNVHLELNCVGRLELVDRPAPVNLSPMSSEYVRFSVKVTSAEAGRIFGSIAYEVHQISGSDQRLLPTAVITVCSSDYLEPAPIDSVEFCQKWEDFEWEKKIPVNNACDTLENFINKLCRYAKLQPVQAADFSLPFVTVNLYSKSYFGEEVLANINVEHSDGIATGFLRIRTDSQSLAISFSRLIQGLK